MLRTASDNLMRAAVHTDAFRLEVRDRDIPLLSENDHVLLRVGAVGICGSDKHDLDHAPEREQVPGHEFSGIVADIGPDSLGFSLGDRVLVRPRSRCGSCGLCRSGAGDCENPGVYGCRGVQHPPGAMAEYVLVRSENLTRLPDRVTLEQASLTDPLAVALHAVELSPPVRNQTCVVMGAGVIGLLLAQALGSKGAGKVVLVDVRQSHLDTAAGLGDFDCLLAGDRPTLAARLKKLGSGIYFELAGGESPTLDIAIECIEKWGSILLVSQRPAGTWLNYQWVMGKGLTLQGVPGTSDSSWKEAEEMIFDGKVDPDPIITHRFALEQATEALRVATHEDSLKVIIKPNGDIG